MRISFIEASGRATPLSPSNATDGRVEHGRNWAGYTPGIPIPSRRWTTAGLDGLIGVLLGPIGVSTMHQRGGIAQNFV